MRTSLSLLFAALLLLCATQSGMSAADDSSSLIVYEAISESGSNSGSRSSSRTRLSVVEQLISAQGGDLEIEYTFPTGDVPDIEAWKLPARVLIKPGESIELLNEPEIAIRLEQYLDKYPEVRQQCGEVVFTWTSIEIHCDTSHVVDVVSGFNLHLGPLSDGELYGESAAVAPAPLIAVSSGEAGQILEVQLELDPTILLTEYERGIELAAAMTGVSARSVMSTLLQLDDDEDPVFSGIRVVTIKRDTSGRIVTIHRETLITIKGGGTFQETRKKTETLRRLPLD